MEAPPEPRSRRRARALPPQHGPAMASHVASTWPRPCCTAQPPPAALYARTTVRLRLWVPSMGTDKMPVRPGRPCAAMAMATRLMAETGMMMPASGSDGSCWSKVAEMQQLRMPPHERQWSTTLLPLDTPLTVEDTTFPVVAAPPFVHSGGPRGCTNQPAGPWLWSAGRGEGQQDVARNFTYTVSCPT